MEVVNVNTRAIESRITDAVTFLLVASFWVAFFKYAVPVLWRVGWWLIEVAWLTIFCRPEF